LAFGGCINLAEIYFQGNAPSLGGDVFSEDTNFTVYYLPETTGGGAFDADSGLSPGVLWNPQVETADAGFGGRINEFRFTVTGSSGLVVVVEACAGLAHPAWILVATNTLTGGSFYFSDPQWMNYPDRFFRLSMP
jgi:hypothetical protein